MSVNFLDQWKTPKGTIGGMTWNKAIEAGFTPQQIKVAVQQQNQAGVSVNSAPGQFFHEGGPMRGVAGMHSSKNPMGQFQGPQGNLGLSGYMAAKGLGYTPDEIKQGAASGGMFLPTGSLTQYNMDKQAESDRDQMINYMQQLTEAANRPQPRVGRSSSYVVGTGGAAEIQQAANLKKDRDRYKSTKRWSREAFAAQLNTGAAAAAGNTAGAASGSVNL